MWLRRLPWVTLVRADSVAQADFHRRHMPQLSIAAEQPTAKFNDTEQPPFHFAHGFLWVRDLNREEGRSLVSTPRGLEPLLERFKQLEVTLRAGDWNDLNASSITCLINGLGGAENWALPCVPSGMPAM